MMIRFCSVFALAELALLAAFVGLPAAQADPAEECCMLDLSHQCNGCFEGYKVDSGVLYGCFQAGQQAECHMIRQECAWLPGPVQKYTPGCVAPLEINYGGFMVIKYGCGQPQECD